MEPGGSSLALLPCEVIPRPQFSHRRDEERVQIHPNVLVVLKPSHSLLGLLGAKQEKTGQGENPIVTAVLRRGQRRTWAAWEGDNSPPWSVTPGSMESRHA